MSATTSKTTTSENPRIREMLDRASMPHPGFSKEFISYTEVVSALHRWAGTTSLCAPKDEPLIPHLVRLVQVRDPEQGLNVPGVLVESGTLSSKAEFQIDGQHRSMHYGILDAKIEINRDGSTDADVSVKGTQKIDFRTVDLTKGHEPIEVHGGTHVALIRATPTQRDLALMLTPAEINFLSTRVTNQWEEQGSRSRIMDETPAAMADAIRTVPLYCIGRICYNLSQIQGIFTRQQACGDRDYCTLRDMGDIHLNNRQENSEPVAKNLVKDVDDKYLKLTYGEYADASKRGLFSQDACIQVQEFVTKEGGGTKATRAPVQIDLLTEENTTIGTSKKTVAISTTISPPMSATTRRTQPSIAPTELKTPIPLPLDDILAVSREVAKAGRAHSQDAMVLFVNKVGRRLEEKGFPENARQLKKEIEGIRRNFGVLATARMALSGGLDA